MIVSLDSYPSDIASPKVPSPAEPAKLCDAVATLGSEVERLRADLEWMRERLEGLDCQLPKLASQWGGSLEQLRERVDRLDHRPPEPTTEWGGCMALAADGASSRAVLDAADDVDAQE